MSDACASKEQGADCVLDQLASSDIGHLEAFLALPKAHTCALARALRTARTSVTRILCAPATVLIALRNAKKLTLLRVHFEDMRLARQLL